MGYFARLLGAAYCEDCFLCLVCFVDLCYNCEVSCSCMKDMMLERIVCPKCKGSGYESDKFVTVCELCEDGYITRLELKNFKIEKVRNFVTTLVILVVLFLIYLGLKK